MARAIERQLIVFDFDWSLADQDSDRWIFEVLAPDLRRKMKTLKQEIQWTDLVAQSLRELHSRGGTRTDIEGALKVMPFHPAMVRGVTVVKEAQKPTTTFLCLSNANSVFISTILQSKGLQDLFSEIVTNPAEWDPSGLLKLRRRVDPTGPQHREELEAFIARRQPDFDRIIYVGDGSNDFCPILRLRRCEILPTDSFLIERRSLNFFSTCSQDMVLCRQYRGLEKRIAKEGEKEGLKCQIRYWAGAWEVEEIFQQLPDIVENI
ncbi:hypothetical protein EW146_g7815 [Bondarzewia mesenterica]|uniref:Uncharacterized protein n=1 Tax=Bondarzewia mesenterica TaxID=1095465 RepID=A0A4V3XE38_9AGAM|nr:hypothetical protein EW146_g7815 [Bondarzewia mesenterica]